MSIVYNFYVCDSLSQYNDDESESNERVSIKNLEKLQNELIFSSIGKNIWFFLFNFFFLSNLNETPITKRIKFCEFFIQSFLFFPFKQNSISYFHFFPTFFPLFCWSSRHWLSLLSPSFIPVCEIIFFSYQIFVCSKFFRVHSFLFSFSLNIEHPTTAFSNNTQQQQEKREKKYNVKQANFLVGASLVKL